MATKTKENISVKDAMDNLAAIVSIDLNAPGHLRDINEIRSRIVHVISSLFELQREVEARREELAFRKIKDPGHERYLRLLENHLAFQYAAMNPN